MKISVGARRLGRNVRGVYLALFAAFAGGVALAQPQPVPRITRPIDDSQRVILKGNVHPLAQARYDQGAVEDSFPAQRMLLLLRRGPEQEAALRQFLQDAHTQDSPSYHKWLKPEKFGRLYGPADSDIAAVTAWLRSRGLSVARVSKGKTAIEFSGSAGQLRAAFRTELHTYRVQGEIHHANDRDPQIPAALEPVVAGIASMNDFLPKSYATVLGRATYDPKTHRVTPQWTLETNFLALALAPGDFAVQYNLNPLYNAGVNGTGVTIGIIGASNVDPGVVATYRSVFGLPASPLNVVIDGNDPGQNYALIESYLDIELAGAVAPGATINLYTAADTSVQSGLSLAALRAVDDDEAAVLSTSYGMCEQAMGSAGNQFWAAVWEQAAAQGQTSLVASGDGGSAGCDDFGLARPAQHGLAVSGFSSTPWNVSVGGTDFYYSSYSGTSAVQNAQLATYWNLTPSLLPTISLLSPVAEQPWNNAFGLNLDTGGVYDPASPTIVAGSGGASSCSSGVDATDGSYASCSAGYPKPAWQTGPGVPVDGVRDLPDVSLFAANGANDSFYPICISILSLSQECVPEADGSIVVSGVGGTSASSPAMAGIMALINQKYGPQGQANFTLYPLAAQHPSAFHDVNLGSINVPCLQGTPSCTLSTAGDNTMGSYTLGEYYAAAGYDQATGLGSVDASSLVNNWNSLHFAPTSTTLNLDQTTFTHGTPVTVTAHVTGAGGAPSGEVALVTTASPAVNTGLGALTLQSGTASSSFNNLPGGKYTLTARYAGDALFAPSNSAPVSLDVAPEDSTISLSGLYYDYSSKAYLSLSDGGSYPYGSYIIVDARPTGVNAPPGSTDGIATGTVGFIDSASAGMPGSGVVNVNLGGVAEWIPSTGFPAGSHSLRASYSGDASFKASSSTTPLTFTITKIVPTVTLSANPAVVAVGSTTALTLRVVASNTAPPPTGTATFYFGATVLGTASLDPLGEATLVASGLPLGTDSITASYSGDANCNPATSSAINVTVAQPSNLSVTIDPNPVNTLASFTVRATVRGPAGLPTPTGLISYFVLKDYSSWSGTVPLEDGSASADFPASAFGIGNASVKVSYLGDQVYAPSSVALSVTVTVPFTISGTPVVVSAGATTGNTSTVTVTPEGGFTSGVYVTCALSASPAGAQYPPSCSIPPYLNFAGGSPASATMTISSTGTSASANALPMPNRMRRLVAYGGGALLGITLLGFPARGRRRRSLLSLLFVLALLGGLAGCGGRSKSGGSPGTTPGGYTFTVTASGQGFSANTAVAVTIQ